jgi:predicted RNA-binding Zn ribbon-like protein
MSVTGESAFRLDNESLAFRFTATLTDRHGSTLERLATPQSLATWWVLNGLGFENMPVTESDLAQARQLREVIHRVGSAVAKGRQADSADVEILNGYARAGAADLALVDGRACWEIPIDEPNLAAMRIVAHDAIFAVGGQDADRVRACERAECRGLFIDTSRAGNRRWCSMNTCGNREKKAQMKRANVHRSGRRGSASR